MSPFAIAFASGLPALFSGLIPVPRGPHEAIAVAVPHRTRGPLARVGDLVGSGAQQLAAPLDWVPQSTAFRLAFLLGGMLAGAFLLLGFSLVPPRVMRWTPIPVQLFVEARGYVGLFAASLVVAVALAYALGALQP